MGKRKIQDESELVRWIEEGRTYQWMSEEYMRKYHIEASPTMFSQFRRRKGLEGRNVRDDDLIPWAIRPEHRWGYAVQMLRTAGRERAGRDVSPLAKARLETFKASLEEANAVVHYEPDTEQGWFYVPRREGEDLIRVPVTKTTERHSLD